MVLEESGVGGAGRSGGKPGEKKENKGERGSGFTQGFAVKGLLEREKERNLQRVERCSRIGPGKGIGV